MTYTYVSTKHHSVCVCVCVCACVPAGACHVVSRVSESLISHGARIHVTSSSHRCENRTPESVHYSVTHHSSSTTPLTPAVTTTKHSPFDTHCCHMGTAAINHPMTDRVKLSECPDVKNYKWWLNPVWHRMLYSSSTHRATVAWKGWSLQDGISLDILDDWANTHVYCPVTGYSGMPPLLFLAHS